MKVFASFAFVFVANAAELKLTWSDCGDASTKTKITAFSPNAVTLGHKTTMVGTGSLSEDVAGADYDLEMTGAIGKLLSCKGDASTSKTCSLPLGVGTLSFEAMTFPLKAGASAVNVDILLKPFVPRALQTTTTRASAIAKNGDKLFCIEIKSAPAQDAQPEPLAPVAVAEPAVAQDGIDAAGSNNLGLTWSDCGDTSTKTKITAFSPNALTLGQKIAMVGTGSLSEDVAGADYDLEMTGAIGKLLSCKGDASTSKTCSLPLGVGTLSFEAMTFPLKAGATAVNVDILLKPFVPRALQTTTTRATAIAKNGDKLFCIEIKSAPTQDAQLDLAAPVVV